MPLRKSSLLHTWANHLLLVHGGSHTIWIHLAIVIIHYLLMHHCLNALLLSNWTVFVSKKKSFKVNDLISQLRYLGAKVVVLATIHFHFCLQICEPLLFALSTLECGNPIDDISTFLLRVFFFLNRHTCCARESSFAFLHLSFSCHWHYTHLWTCPTPLALHPQAPASSARC